MRALKENCNGRFQKVPAACGLVNVSRNTLMRIAGISIRTDFPNRAIAFASPAILIRVFLLTFTNPQAAGKRKCIVSRVPGCEM